MRPRGHVRGRESVCTYDFACHVCVHNVINHVSCQESSVGHPLPKQPLHGVDPFPWGQGEGPGDGDVLTSAGVQHLSFLQRGRPLDAGHHCKVAKGGHCLLLLLVV